MSLMAAHASLQDALAASRRTLQAIHNVVSHPFQRLLLHGEQQGSSHEPAPPNSLERFSELRSVTVGHVSDSSGCLVPLLPVSLRTLTLDAGADERYPLSRGAAAGASHAALPADPFRTYSVPAAHTRKGMRKGRAGAARQPGDPASHVRIY